MSTLNLAKTDLDSNNPKESIEINTAFGLASIILPFILRRYAWY